VRRGSEKTEGDRVLLAVSVETGDQNCRVGSRGVLKGREGLEREKRQLKGGGARGGR